MFRRAIWNKLPECIFEYFENAPVKRRHFKIFKNHSSDLSKKSTIPNMWLLVNHTKRTNTLYGNKYLLTVDNYKITPLTLQC